MEKVPNHDDTLADTIPVLCTARIPIDLLNEFLTTAFSAPELAAVKCTHIAILVDTLDRSKLTNPTHAPINRDIEYPFLNWTLDALVKFVSALDRGETGIIDTEFVVLDERTLTVRVSPYSSLQTCSICILPSYSTSTSTLIFPLYTYYSPPTQDKTVALITPSEMSDEPLETCPRLLARSDFMSSLITLNCKSMAVGGDEAWEEAEKREREGENAVIRWYGREYEGADLGWSGKRLGEGWI
ncbi:hypothetical protein CC86DRAFT_453023 [Ophiobolus disseminans]|uniref:Uncharacterized protein n=1 Tax=Ophiobolus disseminans TaxID=1469910 RepID=A0A6A7AD52_9PLEO|nr:hypothetical protein CC86DRAFT_453023 [Ophiobolus disseminans]